MRIFITGAAGFIGFHVSKYLLSQGHHVLGFDNLNDYYPVHHKNNRLKILKNNSKFTFIKGDIEDQCTLFKTHDVFKPSHIIHLAAQAGVRHSITHPDVYMKSNIVGFQNVMELVRHERLKKFIYASSSSIYDPKNTPLRENDKRKAKNIYAATKIFNEDIANLYHESFGINSIGLRFFTVYGQYARPDMSMFKFAEAMRTHKPIQLYNNGNMKRDFTYVEDIVQGIVLALNHDDIHDCFNLGFGGEVSLEEMIDYLSQELRIPFAVNMCEMPLGDRPASLSDITKAKVVLGYDPKINIMQGISKFCEWYLHEYLQITC